MIDAVLVGAGGRGAGAYGPHALRRPEELRFVAVAEPNTERRSYFAALHAIPPERQFASWQELCVQPQLARAAVNCTQDRIHAESTLALLHTGYDVLLEKPIAPTPQECVALINTAESLGRTLQICHVLRFTAFFSSLFEIVRSGRLGRIVTVDHRENVSYWHMAHSFVRGHWRNQAESSPMILAKCCHDLDLLVWTLGCSVQRLSSFGALTHYRPEHAPPGAPLRCTDGCPVERSCPWYAPRLYEAAPSGVNAPVSDLPPFHPHDFLLRTVGGSTPQERWERLRDGPYGRCVYHCDNDVVDHQTLLLEFENGVTVTFTMHGHSEREGRTMRWDGTRATLFGDFSDGRPHEIRIYDHGSDTPEIVRPTSEDGGHGGGDMGLMRDFVRALRGEPTTHQTTACVSLESHLLAFAAEQARLTRQVVEMDAFVGNRFNQYQRNITNPSES
jgi:predicted dehydrogenase